jgi:hypothetical protein
MAVVSHLEDVLSTSEIAQPVTRTATEPYIVAHNSLLVHGAAVKLYKHKYQV